MIEPGKVYLVGAGPGALDLLTLRARELICACDVLVYDYLANSRLASWTRAECEQIYVGKQGGRHSIEQSAIEVILLEKAREGKSVVRLKGGDPFIFGRGGEEMLALRKNGIPFEVVPGITAAIGAGAYAGIPLTHRTCSSSVTFLTGHENVENHTLHTDFTRFAEIGGTLCIYMGVSTLADIVEALKRGGMPEATPVAIIQWATMPDQRTARTTLGMIEHVVEHSGFGAPSVIIVGDVAAPGLDAGWFEQKPLQNKRVVVTRNRDRASELAHQLEQLGADVLELPLIEIVDRTDEAREQELLATVHQYRWLLFTSANGVDGFFRKFYKTHPDIRILGGVSIACIGTSTARAVRQHHLEVDFIPGKAVGEAFIESFLQQNSVEHETVLVVTGNLNREVIVDGLNKARAIVDTLQVYNTLPTDLSRHPEARRFREQGADIVTFTASSTVDNFIRQAENLALAEAARKPLFASIGPVTSKRLREKGLPVDVEASESNLTSLVDAIVKRLESRHQPNGGDSD